MIEIKNICKAYKTGDFVQRALDDVSITFRESEFVAVLGPSGSGKTTFLNILGGFDHADSGDIVINGISTKDYSDKDWDTYRNHRVGFIFQSYNLIPHQTVLGNVELALTLAGVSSSERRERAKAALEQVGLGDHINKKPAQLSGGQMQRVAIARALVNDPEIVLADEPTGALDTDTGVQVMDILQGVAKERLVIMVTHNPQLAEDYASRIVNIKDGHIVGDSNPLTEAELEAEAAAAKGSEAPKRKSSMSFLTALALSANNLMTKKGRTFMTAFAGSIGIIGIAAILALSNGVNEYIARVEQDTLSSYPLSITKQSYDITSMISSGADEVEAAQDSASTDSATSAAEQAQTDAKSGKIDVTTALEDMFGSVKSNDMSSLKDFLDAGGNGISDNVTAIQYDYGISPLVFETDTSAGPVRLSPNSMTEAMSGGASSTATASTMMSTSSVFNEMLDDQDLLEGQYDVVAGRWAQAADEAVLVLSANGRVSDYTLYCLGVLDPAELDEIVESTMSGDTEDVEVPENDVDFTYDDALKLSFKVLSPSDAYRKNAETGGWTDMSEDSDFMTSQVASGLDLKIVGVVKPNEQASSSALSQGVAYTHELTEQLMERAANSEIVKQQIANPDVDVFTGKTFDTLQEEAKAGVDLSSLFTIDQNAIQNAFTFDTSALAAANMSNIDMSSIDLSSINIDLSGIETSVDMSSVMAGAPSPDFSSIDTSEIELTPDQQTQLAGYETQLLQGFFAYLTKSGVSDFTDASKLTEALNAYLATDEVKAILASAQEIVGPVATEQMQKVMQSYVTDQLTPYMQTALETAAKQLSEAITTTVQAQLTQGMAQIMDQMATQMTESMQGLGASLQNAFSVDANAFSNAFSFNMDTADLTSLMTNYANASSLTYDNNLTTLGYADESNPTTIKLYPIDFEAKERVLDCIDEYNADMEAAGEDDKVVSYTDYVGVLMSSVTDIVNMISLVLIAFVSISLVVSSIMISIITYISVLERKKEIGILRAMGASKMNIANVFNAETFIEGLIAGVFAIAVVLVASVPVNAWVLRDYNVENIMSLPWSSALILILISVVLTVVAGLIPSFGAARRDPVEALRSE